MSNFKKKILSLILCFSLLVTGSTYADTVIIGSAPSNSDKAVTQNASNTSFIQNQYSGPGLLPSSSNNLGSSPLMSSVSYDNSVGQKSSNVDDHGVANAGPTSRTTGSPSAKVSTDVSSSNQSAVITNGMAEKGTPAENTSDTGPVSHEVSAPSANGRPGINNPTGVIMGGEYVEGSGPAGGTSPESKNVPSYTTNNNNYPTTAGTTNASNFAAAGVIKYDAVNINAAKPSISAASAVVLNASTRQIYFSKDGFGAYAPASLANLVTSTILLSYKGLDDVLTVSQTAVSALESGASTAGLKAGDTIKVRDAIAAMCVSSCCDVANVVAENVSGSINNFVSLMNSTIKQWGCIGTTFANPSGLNNDMQKTNVYDMAIIMDKATQNATLKTFLTLTSYQLPATSTKSARTIHSKNTLLSSGSAQYYQGIGASRMGYTSKAKYTMASEVDYNGNRLIAVVLKANGSQFADTKKLLNYAKVACVEAQTTGIASAQSVQSTTTMTSTVQSATTLSGVDIQGSWVQENNGWVFVKADGSRANNEWIKQNGKMYCVDSTGFMITGWRVFSNNKFYYFDPANGEFRYNTWVNTSTGAYYLQADGSLAKAPAGQTQDITTSVGVYKIDENGKAIAKVS